MNIREVIKRHERLRHIAKWTLTKLSYYKYRLKIYKIYIEEIGLKKILIYSIPFFGTIEIIKELNRKDRSLRGLSHYIYGELIPRIDKLENRKTRSKK